MCLSNGNSSKQLIEITAETSQTNDCAVMTAAAGKGAVDDITELVFGGD